MQPPYAARSLEPCLLADLLTHIAHISPDAIALTHAQVSLSYADLQSRVLQFAGGLLGLALARGERVGIYLEKCVEAVVACFGTAAAGAVFLPINPLLKPEQVAHILRDCNVRLRVPSPQRHALLGDVQGTYHDLRHVVLTGTAAGGWVGGLDSHNHNTGQSTDNRTSHSPLAVAHWQELAQTTGRSGQRVIETEWWPFCMPRAVRATPRAWCYRTASWWLNSGSCAMVAERAPPAHAPCLEVLV